MPKKPTKSKPKSVEQPRDERFSSSVLFSPENSDMGFLMWIHDRLEHVHGESPLMDYMYKLRAIIAEMNPAQATPSCSQGKNGME